MPAAAQRVAVIGAGPSGAIVSDSLVKEQAFQTIRVFERKSGIGGTWCMLASHLFLVQRLMVSISI